MSAARMKHFGWGREGEGMSAEERAFVLGRYHEKFGRDMFQTVAVPPLDGLILPAPGVTPPASLEAFCTTERYDRAAHTYGKSYLDYVRAMLGQYDCAPDVVAYPRNEAEISAVMDWAESVGAAIAPFGGDPVSAAASSIAEMGATTRPSPSTSAISARCWRWTRSRARPGSREARSGRRSKRS